jgi:tetratricopeptide (TPR) repeat protein
MFEEPSSASEKPSDTIEKAIPISIEVPPEKEKVKEEVSPIDLATLTEKKTTDVEPPKEQESPKEINQVETISAIFEGSDQKAAQDLLEEEPPKTEEIVPESIKETEKEKVTVPTEEPEKPEGKAATMEEKKEKPTATQTLAEIYLTQGFLEEALNIYRELLDADPKNEKLKIKIEELEKQSLSEQKPQEQAVQDEPSIEGESPQQTSEEKPSIDTNPREPTQEEKRDQSKNLDNFQDWLKKFQK